MDAVARLTASSALRPILASTVFSLCSFLSASLYEHERRNLWERSESSLLFMFTEYLIILSETSSMRSYQWQTFILEIHNHLRSLLFIQYVQRWWMSPVTSKKEIPPGESFSLLLFSYQSKTYKTVRHVMHELPYLLICYK